MADAPSARYRAQILDAFSDHAARLGWRTADTLWRAAGDTATDLNQYSKRATLGAMLAQSGRCYGPHSQG